MSGYVNLFCYILGVFYGRFKFFKFLFPLNLFLPASGLPANNHRRYQERYHMRLGQKSAASISYIY